MLPLPSRRANARARTRARAAVLVAFTAAIAAALAGPQPGSGATATTVVAATVPSATHLDVTACASDVPNMTDFGTVTPGSSAVTSVPCAIEFGSSNDTSALRLWQTDRGGSAMHGTTRGALDSGFDGDGWTRLLSSSSDHGSYVAVASDERFMLAIDGVNNDFEVQRRHVDGTLDTTFSGDGRLEMETALGASNSRLRALLVDDADRTTIVGGDNNVDVSFACRVDAAGTPDTSFGGSGTGCVTFDVAGGIFDLATAVAEHPAGGIVVAGARDVGPYGAWLARFDDDGELMTGWGSGGFWFQPTGSTTEVPVSIAVQQSTGRVLVGSMELNATHDAVVFAVDVDTGTTDTSFGSSGSYAIDRGSSEMVGALQVDQHDRVVAAVHRPTGGTTLGLVRLDVHATGIDPAFNGGALRASTMVHLKENTLDRVTLAVDGTGSATVGVHVSDGTNGAAGFWRLGPSGVPDTAFAPSGELIVSDAGDLLTITSLAAVADGRLLIGGRVDVTTETGLLMLSAPTVPQYAAGSDWATPGASHFGACMVGTANTTLDASTWTLDANAGADCADGDADPWRAIPRWPADPDPNVRVVLARSDSAQQQAASVSLVFCFRAAANQPAGRYLAQVTFETVAPEPV